MGVALPSLMLLLIEHKARPFYGTILQLGRQDIYFDYETFQACAENMGVTLRKLDQITHRANECMPTTKTIDDQTFFKSLGFDVVQSTDASDYEQADFIHDFNRPVPAQLHNRFDMVFDGGAIEHLFHVPNALSNINALLKVGGRVNHHSPTHNYVDHGFYCFQPTLFYDYYEADAYTELRCHFVGLTLPFKQNEIPKIFPYTPGMLETFSVGGITKEKCNGCEMFMTTFSATKSVASTGSVIPTQRRYREWWAKANGKPAPTTNAPIPPPPSPRILPQTLIHHVTKAHPLISVTLPNYNHGTYLKQAIESVLMQSYRNLEILVTDDGSTDNSVEIIRRYARQDPRVKAAYFDKNQGAQAAHAETWKRVTGEIIYQFSSDDYLCHPDFFALGVAALAENPAAAGFFGIADVMIIETGRKMCRMGQAEPIGYVSPEQFLQGFLTRGFFVPGISSLWYKSEILAVGGYDSRLGPQSDYFINHALPARSGVVFNPKVFAHTRTSLEKKSYSGSASLEDEVKRFELFATKMRQVIRDGGTMEHEWNRWSQTRAKELIEKHGGAEALRWKTR